MRVKYGTMELIGIVEVGVADLAVGGIRCASFFLHTPAIVTVELDSRQSSSSAGFNM